MSLVLVLAAYLIGVCVGMTLKVHFPTPWVGPVSFLGMAIVGALAARLRWRG